MLSSVALALGLMAVTANPAWSDHPTQHHSPAQFDSCAAGCGDAGACYDECGPWHNAHGRRGCVNHFLLRHCDMPPHLPYDPPAYGYYYFRPYHYSHIARHQQFVAQYGGDPRHPYANFIFDHIYADCAAPSMPPPEAELIEPEESPSDAPPAPPSLAPPGPPDAAPAAPAPPAPGADAARHGQATLRLVSGEWSSASNRQSGE